MAVSFLLLLVLSLLLSCQAAPVELGIQFDKFDKRASTLPNLVLPYGTYRASSYDADADVRPDLLSVAENHVCSSRLDLPVQEHSLCCPSGGRSSMGEACSASKRDDGSGRILRAYMCSSTHQRPTIDRSWRKLPCWSSHQSISWRHSCSFIQSSFRRQINSSLSMLAY